MESNNQIPLCQDYVDDFWDTFNAEEKVQLKAEGFEKREHETIVVDFKTKTVVRRYKI